MAKLSEHFERSSPPALQFCSVTFPLTTEYTLPYIERTGEYASVVFETPYLSFGDPKRANPSECPVRFFAPKGRTGCGRNAYDLSAIDEFRARGMVREKTTLHGT